MFDVAWGSDSNICCYRKAFFERRLSATEVTAGLHDSKGASQPVQSRSKAATTSSSKKTMTKTNTKTKDDDKDKYIQSKGASQAARAVQV